MIYLPDMKNINCKSIDRDFLFNIINTVDRQFFAKEIERYERIQAEKYMKEDPDKITITPELYHLIVGLPT